MIGHCKVEKYFVIGEKILKVNRKKPFWLSAILKMTFPPIHPPSIIFFLKQIEMLKYALKMLQKFSLSAPN